MSLISIPTLETANSYVTLAEAEAYLINRQDISNWSSLTDAQKEAILIMATNHIDSFRFFGCEIIDRPEYYRDKQKLKFPRTKNSRTQSGTPDTIGDNYIIDSDRVDNSSEPNDFWNDGAIIITDGTGKGQTRKVSDFDFVTGKITVSEIWTTNPDTTSQYYLVQKIPDDVKNATYEQALFIAKTVDSEREVMQASGVTEYKIGDLMEKFGGVGSGKVNMSNVAQSYLSGFISKIGRITL